MSTSDVYDPTPDLEAQHAGVPTRVAVFFMMMTAVLELGVFFQTQMLVTAELWLDLWFWSKLGIAVLALVTALRAYRLRPGADVLWIATSCLVTIEGAAWLGFSFYLGFFSCFSPLVVVPAVVSVIASIPIRQAMARAREARARLAEHDLDDVF